jgi:hypothetical protein
MLPRIASLDEQFAQAIRNYVQARAHGTQLLRSIKSHVIHEGYASAIRRNKNELEQTKMTEAIAETTMQFEDIENMDLEYVIAKANEISQTFEEHFSRYLFQTMDEVTQKTGLRKDARGAPLTDEALIEVLSMMSMDFERSPHGDVAIVTSPAMVQTFEKLEREMKETPEIKRKWDAMIEGKRNEFREREINRNLVG